MRNSKLLFVLLIGLVFVVNLFLIGFCFTLAKRSRVALPELRSEIEAQLGIALTNIVDRIILDVGLLQDKTTSKSDSSGNPFDDSKDLFISAEVKTFENSVAWINGVPFYPGDVISPYGALIYIGRDMVVLKHPSGSSYVVARPLPVIEAAPEKAETGGPAGTPPAGPPASAVGAA